MRRRRNLEIIAGRVNADGTIATGDGFSVSVPGTGHYLITFASGFRLFAMTVSSQQNAVPGAIAATSTTPNSAEIWMNSPSSVLTASAFQFIAVGMQQ